MSHVWSILPGWIWWVFQKTEQLELFYSFLETTRVIIRLNSRRYCCWLSSRIFKTGLALLNWILSLFPPDVWPENTNYQGSVDEVRTLTTTVKPVNIRNVNFLCIESVSPHKRGKINTIISYCSHLYNIANAKSFRRSNMGNLGFSAHIKT